MRVSLTDAFGTVYPICTRNTELLEQWFAEILPDIYPESEGYEYPAPWIEVYPESRKQDMEYDWFTDSRVLMRRYPFPYRTGPDAIKGFELLRDHLKAQVEAFDRGDGEL